MPGSGPVVVLMPLNCGRLVEIAVVGGVTCLARRARDIDDDAVRVEFVGEKRHANDEGRPMHPLRGTENLPAKGMGDHDLVGDFNRVHENSSSCVFIGAGIADRLADDIGIGAEHRRQRGWQFLEPDGRREQRVQHRVLEQRKRRRKSPP